jgi:hypothetical protein
MLGPKYELERPDSEARALLTVPRLCVVLSDT